MRRNAKRRSRLAFHSSRIGYRIERGRAPVTRTFASSFRPTPPDSCFDQEFLSAKFMKLAMGGVLGLSEALAKWRTRGEGHRIGCFTSPGRHELRIHVRYAPS